jgi:hypothetical protein
VGGTLITPAHTNLLDSVNTSSFETSVSGLTGLTLAVSRVADSGAVGSYAAKAVLNNSTAGLYLLETTRNLSLSNGTAYVIHARMRSIKPVKVDMKLYKATPAANTTVGDISYITVDSTWRTYASNPITADATLSNYSIGLLVNKLTEPVELYVDGLDIQAVPVCGFQIGGTPQAADVLTAVVAVPSAWTDLFAVQTIGQERHYTAAGNLSVKTWKTDADNFICLYYTVSDSKFCLQRTIAGVAQTAVRSSMQEWHPNQVIKFALRADGSGLALSIQNGRAIETIADGVAAAQLSAPITMIYGDALSAGQFPGTYVDGTMAGTSSAGVGFFPFRLTDGDIAAAFNLTPRAGAGGG